MTVTSHTTSYQLLRLYLAGQLSPDDCPAAIEICKTSWTFWTLVLAEPRRIRLGALVEQTKIWRYGWTINNASKICLST